MRNRKLRTALFLAVLLMVSLFAGCAAEQDDADEFSKATWDLADAKPEYLTEWPDNVFTEKIPRPRGGTIDYVLDYTDSGRYAIFVKEISSEESDQYVKTLKSNGYSEMHSDANGVSVGIMLKSKDAYLSVSYADGVLGILMTLRGPS